MPRSCSNRTRCKTSPAALSRYSRPSGGTAWRCRPRCPSKRRRELSRPRQNGRRRWRCPSWSFCRPSNGTPASPRHGRPVRRRLQSGLKYSRLRPWRNTRTGGTARTCKALRRCHPICASARSASTSRRIRQRSDPASEDRPRDRGTPGPRQASRSKLDQGNKKSGNGLSISPALDRRPDRREIWS